MVSSARGAALTAARFPAIVTLVGIVEFEVVRTIGAPMEQVFARLADIEGHNDWMPQKGSILRRTQQTSPGEPALGTTYLDETSLGPTPGEVVEFNPPHRLVYHWWDHSKAGKVRLEGWPGYTLEATDPSTTVVRHHAIIHTHGLYRFASPLLRRIAAKERTATMDALKLSFESHGNRE
ncbi:SRPBCC family protein [Intrasporangium sp.]|uniref:SRPBCC family protein n=1 Tax=Intrasporangium sp. TaxID=1925024 RepID=UPI002B492609|nr:SRPBCC family protein [Intrasporangium sp.]